PGGGLTKQGKWKTARSDGKYLFNVKAMSKTFRGRFIAALKEQLPKEMTKELVNRLYKHNWVVYAKRPFTGPQSVVEYLGRYTHKIAISNHRIQNIEDGKVSFSYKDYKHGSVKKEMSLEAIEFIRRFSLHILPKGFVRIRHHGICSSSSKVKSALIIKAQLPPSAAQLFGAITKAAPEAYDPKQCLCCKKQTMETLMRFNRRGPPDNWKEKAAILLTGIKAVNVTTVE
ncbi:MAG TPA: transposase, partial [Niastella sp.]|nr:transposase [Niastella sp.]